jgi:CBS domain-containing protein
LERISHLEVGRVATTPFTLSPSTPLSKVIGALKDRNRYEVFVEERGRVGLLTIRELIKSSNITTEKAGSLAVNVPALSPNTSIAEAARLMIEFRIRALPVIVGSKLVGEVTTLSIMSALRELDLGNVKASDLMTGQPMTLNVDDAVAKARRLMIRRRIDHLPVMAEKKLAGIVTSNVLVFNLVQVVDAIESGAMVAETRRRLDFPVHDIMDSNPLTCNLNDGVNVVFEAMTRRASSYAIVTLWDEVQGILTYSDYMKLFAEQLQTKEIPVYIIGLPDDPFDAEMSRSKFLKSIEFLRKSYPFIEEAKAVIKSYERETQRRRYEVDVAIVTPRKTYTYSETGWELPAVFDRIATKLKGMMTSRRRRRRAFRR